MSSRIANLKPDFLPSPVKRFVAGVRPLLHWLVSFLSGLGRSGWPRNQKPRIVVSAEILLICEAIT